MQIIWLKKKTHFNDKKHTVFDNQNVLNQMVTSTMIFQKKNVISVLEFFFAK